LSKSQDKNELEPVALCKNMTMMENFRNFIDSLHIEMDNIANFLDWILIELPSCNYFFLRTYKTCEISIVGFRSELTYLGELTGADFLAKVSP